MKENKSKEEVLEKALNLACEMVSLMTCSDMDCNLCCLGYDHCGDVARIKEDFIRWVRYEEETQE